MFISDPDQHDSASQHTLGELFSLTPAEANVAILLARGLSLAEVSAGAEYLPAHRQGPRSILTKTGVSARPSWCGW